MKEFDYELDYKNIDFTVEENRKLYRIGRGEQGVLLGIMPSYTNDICSHWRFVNEDTARQSAAKIYEMFVEFRRRKDFIGMDMAIFEILGDGFTIVSDGMLIIQADANTIKMVKSVHKK